MKKHFLTFATVALLLAVGATLRAPGNRGAFDIAGFGHVPALLHGRVKPLDTVARTSLLMLQGRQRVTTAQGAALSPAEWLLDVMYRPELADTYQVFEVVHPDVLAMLNLSTADGARGKRFSLVQLRPGLRELDRQAKLADEVEAPLRTPFQRGSVQLRNAVLLYQHLQVAIIPPGTDDYFAQLARLEAALPKVLGGEPVAQMHDSPEARHVLEMARAFATMEQFAHLRLVPSATEADQGWQTIGGAWTRTLATGKIDPTARRFTEIGRAWRDRSPEAFNRTVAELRNELARTHPLAVRKNRVEVRFNSAQPFYTSTGLYVVAFLCGVVSWLKWGPALGRLSFRVLLVAFMLTTAGIVTRMWLEGRPPVTNLYSSALFVGWGAVALCLVLERIYCSAIGAVAGGLVGFCTLLIAHHLALGGDTMEMMRAVLDSNFWLATHVVTIAVGYSATFLAGFLAAIYVVRAVFTRTMDAATTAALGRMIYGILCFATLFSFVGTILGGIWADQSWGRFWGWDPKENGALLIVVWNAIILHARWAGLVKTRGLSCLALFGNVVTAWSWFGVNMLGVGLHSYGFMDSAFWWLIGFAVSQLVLIALSGAVRQTARA